MKPILAMSPSFSRVIRAMVPECTKIPGATSLTGNSAAAAHASVAVTRDKAAITRAMRDTFQPQFKSCAHCTATKKASTQSGKTWRVMRCMASIQTSPGGSAMTEAGRHRRWLFSLSILVASCAFGDAAIAQTNETGDLSFELVDPKVLRVCSAPRNLPFSNEKGEGFENKLAELFADKLQKKLDYMYFPQATGFVRMTLGAHRCDVIMGFPQGDELVQGTNPYYRTAYALVVKPGSGLDDVATLDDGRLKGKHIGIVAGTPPATNMAANGLMMNAKPYPLMVDTRFDSSAEAMIGDLLSGQIDAAILWGPMAGFYAKRANPPLHVTPLVKETTGPRLVYRIGMGVRAADQNWKRQLNRLIQENQPAINKILLDFGVPLLDENDKLIGTEAATKSP